MREQYTYRSTVRRPPACHSYCFPQPVVSSAFVVVLVAIVIVFASLHFRCGLCGYHLSIFDLAAFVRCIRSVVFKSCYVSFVAYRMCSVFRCRRAVGGCTFRSVFMAVDGYAGFINAFCVLVHCAYVRVSVLVGRLAVARSDRREGRERRCVMSEFDSAFMGFYR